MPPGRDSTAPAASPKRDPAPSFVEINPALRYLNHAVAGITGGSRVAVRVDRRTGAAEYEPTKAWIRHSATAVLFSATAATIWYRRRRLERVGGLVSLAGAVRPVLSGIAWTTGIAAALNARPIEAAEPSAEPKVNANDEKHE